MTETVYDDFKLNWDFSAGRVRCHGKFDLDVTETGDICRTFDGGEYLLNKLYLWFAIKQGEVIGHPEIGCPIHKYFFRKFTQNETFKLQQELSYALTTQLPELNIITVICKPNRGMDRIEITMSTKDYGDIYINALKSDFLELDLETVFQAAFQGAFEI